MSEARIDSPAARFRGKSPAQPLRRLSTLLLDESDMDRTILRDLMDRHPALEVLDEARTVDEALELIRRHSPDVVFCESRFNSGSLRDLASHFPSHIQFVIVTGDRDFAWHAFELDAVDFLLKPVIPERLGNAVRRLLRIEWKQPSPAAPEDSMPAIIPFERGRRSVFLDDICMIQALGSYSRVTLVDDKDDLVFRSLIRWQQMLPYGSFVRVHRNTLVNRSRIRSLNADAGESLYTLQVDGITEQVAVSRRQVSSLKKLLFSGINRSF